MKLLSKKLEVVQKKNTEVFVLCSLHIFICMVHTGNKHMSIIWMDTCMYVYNTDTLQKSSSLHLNHH